MSRTGRRTATILLVVLVGMLLPAQAAFAAPPPNDLESGATKIAAVPFTETIDTTEANTDGPNVCRARYRQNSVFYRFKPATDTYVQFDTFGSDYDTTLAVYRRDRAGDVRLLRRGCNDDRVSLWSGFRLHARAGVKYVFMVGSFSVGGGQLTVNLSEVSGDPLEFTIEITDPGAVDPEGIATISGTVSCNRPSQTSVEATLRQLRDGMWVAKGYLYASAVCVPGTPVDWSTDVDTNTGVAFGAGPARVRDLYSYAYDGWEWVEMGLDSVTIDLVSAP